MTVTQLTLSPQTTLGSALRPPADPSDLFERWQKHADPRAREELVQRYMPLARKLARRYLGAREPLDDLIQVASLGFRPKVVSRLRCFALFWHALDIVWVAIFTVVYLIGAR